MHRIHTGPAEDRAGLFTLSIRLVVGWTYFSAFWRRLVLDNKLNPEEAGYIGEKFNHFLPNALGIKPLIEYLVTHPEQLWWAMAVFTIVEAIVGLFLMLGLFTRLMSVGVFFLAMGILLGAGWLGTTCLDEWQIGVLGVAAGFTLFLSGSSYYSLDAWLAKKRPGFATRHWFAWLGSGSLPLSFHRLKRVALVGAVLIFALTLYTNQYFHGGVLGTLHNKSVKPKIEIEHAAIKDDHLQFDLYRVEGADVYGAFLIGIELTDSSGQPVIQLAGADLAQLPAAQIENRYVAKIKPGKHSLVVPLGARATLRIPDAALQTLAAGDYELKLIDISGLEWRCKITVSGPAS